MESKQTFFARGCGCKLPARRLDRLLESTSLRADLLSSGGLDDVATLDLLGGKLLLQNIDIMSPVVREPRLFGQIAAANALSDIYAKGGRPSLAMDFLCVGDELTLEECGEVLDGANDTCKSVGVRLAGGHTVEGSQTLFGLSVIGFVERSNFKPKSPPQIGDCLYVTKPIGSGAICAARDHGLVDEETWSATLKVLLALNSVGETLASIEGVHCMTDITGFGLAGHLLEMLGEVAFAEISARELPRFPKVDELFAAAFITSGGEQNLLAFHNAIEFSADRTDHAFFDPQTNGGLLIAVAPEAADAVERIVEAAGSTPSLIGYVCAPPLTTTKTRLRINQE